MKKLETTTQISTTTTQISTSGPQDGDRFSFSGSYVDVHFDSDHMIQRSGFSISVMDGYEPNNDISNLGYASRVINKEDFPEKEAKKAE
ncbi:unnamed protein product [Oikopleura dioica]|uniref:CUB domain-containing protein n=1 Tax=Oikopleura dioica TaxID=34765 RepID=E4XTG5_OIKDI|nr:unnamed protein product [Oikopleura dioica]